MICFPNAKINLSLRVTGKRPDGYHNLETIFYPVPYFDILELVSIDKQSPPRDRDSNIDSKQIAISHQVMVGFSMSGIPVDGNVAENLCIRAIRLFYELKGLKNSYRLHLHKNIPMGAGLGGGSSDASFLLRILNEMEGQPASEPELAALALQLGSDCPFFLYNKPALGTGRGELLTPLPMDLAGYHLVIAKPAAHISTSGAFADVVMGNAQGPAQINHVLQKPVSGWQEFFTNDFEKSIFKSYPEVESVRNALIDSGAAFARMSGSGSAVFGLFSNKPQLAGLPSSCIVHHVIL